MKKAKRPGSQPAPGAAQAARVLQALRDFVTDSDRKLSELERRAGYGPGYLQQVLAGAIELKVAHLEEILAALEVPPSRFWPRLLPWTTPGRPRPANLAQSLRVNADVVTVYAGGIAEVLELRRRLGVCERRLGALCACTPAHEREAQPAVLVARR